MFKAPSGQISKLKNLFGDNNQAKTKVIVDLFTNWYTEIDEKLKNSEGIRDVENLNIPSSLLQYPFKKLDQPIYQLASAPLVGVEEANSDLFFVTSTQNSNIILICDEVMDKATELCIFNNIKKSNIPSLNKVFTGAWGNQILNQQLPEGIIWVNPQKYFLSEDLLRVSEYPKLLMTNPEEGAQETDGTKYEIPGGGKYLLPFSFNFIKLFESNDEILDLDPRFVESNGDVTFSFIVKIKYMGITEVKISKTYSLDKQKQDCGRITAIDIPPLLAFWPHFYHEDWKRYFIYKGSADKVSGIRRFDYHPFSYKKRDGIETPNVKWFEANSYGVQEISTFPDVFFVNYKGVSVGSILIRRIEGEKSPKMSFGVDFGTSNTNIWYKSGDEEQKPLSIRVKPRVVTYSDKTDINAGLNERFFPYETPKIPFATIVRKFEENGLGNVITTGMIQFSVDLEKTSNDEMLATNIKWTNNDELTRVFLEHLLLLLAAED
ncbi:hypothetical protein MASR2M39_29890 [Ignavibacteriales bacterium]